MTPIEAVPPYRGIFKVRLLAIRRRMVPYRRKLTAARRAAVVPTHA